MPHAQSHPTQRNAAWLWRRPFSTRRSQPVEVRMSKASRIRRAIEWMFTTAITAASLLTVPGDADL